MAFTQAELNERRRFLGGSESAAALGLCNFFSRLELYKDKIGEGEPIEETLPMMVGTALELVVLRWFEKETGLKIEHQQVRVVDQNNPWRRATLDGIASDGANVQAKCSGMYGWWGKEEDAIPESIVYQVQHEMACGDFKYTWVPVILGQRTFRVYRIERDEELIGLATEGEREFMTMVANHTPPPPRDADDLKILYPIDHGITVVASAEIESIAHVWADTKKQISALEKAEEAAAFQIKEFMKEAATLKGSDGKVLATWKSNVEKRMKVTDFRKDHPGLAEQYSPETVVRKLLNKIK